VPVEIGLGMIGRAYTNLGEDRASAEAKFCAIDDPTCEACQ